MEVNKYRMFFFFFFFCYTADAFIEQRREESRNLGKTHTHTSQDENCCCVWICLFLYLDCHRHPRVLIGRNLTQGRATMKQNRRRRPKRRHFDGFVDMTYDGVLVHELHFVASPKLVFRLRLKTI
jgi:hypothetical protein